MGGLDPQDLYAQNHPPGAEAGVELEQAKGSSTPDAAYMEKFFNRTKQLWDDYHPGAAHLTKRAALSRRHDEVGLTLAAHIYNSSIQMHGRNEAVMNNKMLKPMEREAMVYDIERGKADGILPQPWQTDTCIGSWHYDQAIFQQHRYKSAASVVRMLADIVSKNGNLMLSVPLQRDGQPDSDEIKIVSEIGAWLKINGDAIYRHAPVENLRRRPFDGVRGKRPFRRPERRAEKTLHGRGHPFHPIEKRQDPLCDRAGNSHGRKSYRQIAGERLVGLARQNRQRPPGRRRKLKFTRDETGLHVTLPEKFTGKTAFALRFRS